MPRFQIRFRIDSWDCRTCSGQVERTFMISDGEYSVQDGCATCGSSEPAKRLSAVEAVGLLRKRQDFLRLSIEEMQQDIDSAGRLVAEIEGRRDRPAEAAPAPDPAQPPV